MRSKSLLLRALAVIAMGVASTLAAPPATASTTTVAFSGCAYCRDSCPSDLREYCVDKCNVTGGSCSTGGCAGEDGHYYDYTITCTSPM